MSLCMVLLQVPPGWRFLMSEVPLYDAARRFLRGKNSDRGQARLKQSSLCSRLKSTVCVSLVHKSKPSSRNLNVGLGKTNPLNGVLSASYNSFETKNNAHETS